MKLYQKIFEDSPIKDKIKNDERFARSIISKLHKHDRIQSNLLDSGWSVYYRDDLSSSELESEYGIFASDILWKIEHIGTSDRSGNVWLSPSDQKKIEQYHKDLKKDYEHKQKRVYHQPRKTTSFRLWIQGAERKKRNKPFKKFYGFDARKLRLWIYECRCNKLSPRIQIL